MSHPVLPYESPVEPAGLTGRCVFGVVVRSVGLALVLWGAYTLVYLLGYWMTDAPLGGQPLGNFVVIGLFFVIVGAALVRGRWLVRLAYGCSRDRD